MHIAIFYQYYNNPDCPSTNRLYAHLRRWAPRHQITLLTTRTWFDRRLSRQFDWAPPGVEVTMFDVPYDNTMGMRQRLRSYMHFASRATLKGLSISRPDVILGISTPLTTAWAANVVARRRGVPWVFIVQDLWPSFPIEMGAIKNRWVQRRLYALEHRLYQSAAHIVPFSSDMETHILRHGIAAEKVTTQFNGTDFWLLDACTETDVEALRKAHGLAGKQVVLYGGTMGRANDIPTLILAAERLTHRTDLQFVFIGHGYLNDLVQEAADRLPNVRSLRPQPRHRMLAWFKLADLSLVSFIDRPVLAANSPAKFFDSLGAGTPVIVTNPGWTKRFVEHHRCGWYVPPSKAEALAQRLEEVLDAPKTLAETGQRGAAVARQHFDREVLSDQLEAILLRAAGQTH